MRSSELTPEQFEMNMRIVARENPLVMFAFKDGYFYCDLFGDLYYLSRGTLRSSPLIITLIEKRQ